MDHDATREQLELAAVEPGGLDRLMAGDTLTAQAVAAHIAGCPSCTEELARLQRAAPLIRATVRDMPSPDLKTRTLAAIRAEGVLRPLPAAAGAAATAGGAATAGAALLPTPQQDAADPTPAGPTLVPADARPQPADRPRRIAPVIGWVGTIAAAVVLSVVSTSLIVGNRVDEQLHGQESTISALEEVSTTALSVTAAARRAARRPRRCVEPVGHGQPRLLAVDDRAGLAREWPDASDRRPRVSLLGRCRRDAPRRREDVLQQGPGVLGGGVGCRLRTRQRGDVRGVARQIGGGDSVSSEPVLLGSL